MRPWLVLREAAATAWAAKVPSALVLLLVAVMCAATITTVGRTAAAEQQLVDRLDEAGSRVLSVADARGEGLLPPTVVDQASALSTVERGVGALIPIDVVNGVVGQGGTRVPAWGVHGDLRAVAELTGGRWPGPGEAVVSAPAMAQLGLEDPVGWVAGASTTVVSEWSVVGSFTPREPFDDYATGVLYVAPADQPVDTVHVVLADASSAQVTQAQVIALIAPPTMDALTVTSPVSLAQLQAQVTGDLAAFGATLLLGVLGGGALLVAIVVLADVLVRRKDLGRRRALGATRVTIVGLVVARTVLPALLGAGLGVGAGLLAVSRIGAGVAPPADFSVGTATLAMASAMVAAIPPALYAATRDPVRVLRTP